MNNNNVNTKIDGNLIFFDLSEEKLTDYLRSKDGCYFDIPSDFNWATCLILDDNVWKEYLIFADNENLVVGDDATIHYGTLEEYLETSWKDTYNTTDLIEEMKTDLLDAKFLDTLRTNNWSKLWVERYDRCHNKNIINYIYNTYHQSNDDMLCKNYEGLLESIMSIFIECVKINNSSQDII